MLRDTDEATKQQLLCFAFYFYPSKEKVRVCVCVRACVEKKKKKLFPDQALNGMAFKVTIVIINSNVVSLC